MWIVGRGILQCADAAVAPVASRMTMTVVSLWIFFVMQIVM